MRKYAWLSAVIVTLILPYLAYRIAEDIVLQEDPAQPLTVATEPEEVRSQHKIVVLENGTPVSMDLETYTSRVLLAEMPASFDMEALKAQAVAIRTYTLRQASGGKHENADVCTDSSCCQAYKTEADYTEGEEMLARIQKAVEKTKDQVLVYDGGLIEATYFSSTGGSTEDAVAVWGREVPYLRAQPSPEGKSDKFLETVTFSATQVQQLLELDALPASVGSVTYTDGGGVDSICIGNKTFTGTEVRKKLGLSSTAFLITIVGDSVTITTKGNGHRVGLSQYGAEVMAVEGSMYYEILEYYYPGAKLTTLDEYWV